MPLTRRPRMHRTQGSPIRSSRRISSTRLLYRRGHRRNQRTWQPCRAAPDSDGSDACWSATGGTRGVHSEGVSAWTARSRASRGCRRSDRGRDTPSGSRRLRPARGHIDDRNRGDRCSLFEMTARFEASIDFPEEGYHFVEPTRPRPNFLTIRSASNDCSPTHHADGSSARGPSRHCRPVECRQIKPLQRAARTGRAIVTAVPEQLGIL